jgi:hypothetical protein
MIPQESYSYESFRRLMGVRTSERRKTMTEVEPKMDVQYPNKHPDRVQTLIARNGNAYEDGLLEFRDRQRSR